MAIKTYQDSKDKYLKEKVDTFVLRVPKGKKDEIMEYAASKGMSLNGYITSLVFADMGSEVRVKTVQKPKAAKAKTDKPKLDKPKASQPKAEKTVQKQEAPKQEAPKRRNMPSFLL